MNGPLAGVRVLELASVLAGPYCGMLLGDLGADVVKLERPGTGDDLRGWGPPFTDDGESTYFLSVNRNKRSVAVDLKSEAGLEVVHDLIRGSDVLVENFRPDGMERLGLGSEVLARVNPRLVHCSITAYGPTGPMRDLPGYDVIVQGVGGLMSVTGQPDGPPTRVGVAVVDVATGLYAALGIVAALRERDATGEGQRVSTSLLEVELACMPNLTAANLISGVVPERLGNGHPNTAPYGVFRTRDGEIVLAVGNDVQWRRLCRATGHDDFAEHPRWARNRQRQAGRAELEGIVEGWFAEFDTAALVSRLTAFEVPNGPIQRVDEALASPQAEALGCVVSIPDGDGEPLRLVGSPVHFSARGPAGASPLRPPRLDEDRDWVLEQLLGYSSERSAQLARRGAFGSGG
jgi:crotonobetainyl-CoA:carnitine CoA-transferase CaiB-like acyl-CoA transferase